VKNSASTSSPPVQQSTTTISNFVKRCLDHFNAVNILSCGLHLSIGPLVREHRAETPQVEFHRMYFLPSFLVWTNCPRLNQHGFNSLLDPPQLVDIPYCCIGLKCTAASSHTVVWLLKRGGVLLTQLADRSHTFCPFWPTINWSGFKLISVRGIC
jgi:hypothetical protein